MFLLIVLIFLFPVFLFAQEIPGGDLEQTFATYAGLVAGVVLITGLYKKYISDKNTFIVSIIISTLVCAAGYFFKFGIFEGLLWWHALVYDAGVIFIVKGTVSIDMVIILLNLLKIGPKQESKQIA